MQAFKNFGWRGVSSRGHHQVDTAEVSTDPADGVAWSGWLYKAGTKRKIWRHKFFKVNTRGTGTFEHYGDTKSDKERGVMHFGDTLGVAWLEDPRNYQSTTTTGRSNRDAKSATAAQEPADPNNIDLKFLMLTNDTTWLMRCESYAQKNELQMLFATMVPTLVAVERQSFRRVEKQAITRRKVAKSRFFVLLSNSFLVEFYDDTVSQIKEVEQLQFLRSCTIEPEECYKSLRLQFQGLPSKKGGESSSVQASSASASSTNHTSSSHQHRSSNHSRNALHGETRELLLLFDDTKGVPETMSRVFDRWQTLFSESISAQKARRGLEGPALDLYQLQQAIKFEDFRITPHIKNVINFGLPEEFRAKAWLGFLHGAPPFGFTGVTSEVAFQELCMRHEGKPCIQITQVISDVALIQEQLDPAFLQQVYLIFTIWFHEQQTAAEDSGGHYGASNYGNYANANLHQLYPEGPASTGALATRAGFGGTPIKQYSIGLLFTVIKMLHILRGQAHDVYHVMSAVTHFVLPQCYEGPISEFRIYALAFRELAAKQFPALTLLLENSKIAWNALVAPVVSALFAGYVKTSVLTRIWDLFFISEPSVRLNVLLRSALALIHICRNGLTKFLADGGMSGALQPPGQRLSVNKVLSKWRALLLEGQDTYSPESFSQVFHSIDPQSNMQELLKKHWKTVHVNSTVHLRALDAQLRLVAQTNQLCIRETSLLNNVVERLEVAPLALDDGRIAGAGGPGALRLGTGRNRSSSMSSGPGGQITAQRELGQAELSMSEHKSPQLLGWMNAPSQVAARTRLALGAEASTAFAEPLPEGLEHATIVGTQLPLAVMDVHRCFCRVAEEYLELHAQLCARTDYFSAIRDLAVRKSSAQAWATGRGASSGNSSGNTDNADSNGSAAGFHPSLSAHNRQAHSSSVRRASILSFGHALDSCLWALTSALSVCYEQYLRMHLLEGTWAWHSGPSHLEETNSSTRPRKNTSTGAASVVAAVAAAVFGGSVPDGDSGSGRSSGSSTSSTGAGSASGTAHTGGGGSGNGGLGGGSVGGGALGTVGGHHVMSQEHVLIVSTGKFLYTGLLRFYGLFEEFLRLFVAEIATFSRAEALGLRSSQKEIKAMKEDMAFSMPFASAKTKKQLQQRQKQVQKQKQQQKDQKAKQQKKRKQQGNRDRNGSTDAHSSSSTQVQVQASANADSQGQKLMPQP